MAFDLFGFEYLFYYVLISNFICFGSNALDDRLRVEMYIEHIKIYNICSTLVNLYMYFKTTGLMPLMVGLRSLRSLRIFISSIYSSNIVKQKIAGFVYILSNKNTGRLRKVLHFPSIWLSFSICLDLSTSFIMIWGSQGY